MQYTSSRRPAPLAMTWGGEVVSVVLVVLAAEVVAGSTVAADWVPGSHVLTSVAFASTLLAGGLALLRPLPWPVGLAAWAAAAALAMSLMVTPEVQLDFPGSSISLLHLARQRDFVAEFSQPGAFLYALALAAWGVSGWLAWCVLRWNQALLGVMAPAGLLATNVINYPAKQNPAVFTFLVFALLLMLWISYRSSLVTASRRGVRLAGDMRGTFWTSGAVAMIAVITAGLLMPPLTRVDRTVDVHSGPIKAWADLLNRLNHPSGAGGSQVASHSSGLAIDVALAGPVRRTHGVVMQYTINGQYGGPAYFRALNLVATADGRWRYLPTDFFRAPLPKDEPPDYSESYRDQASASFSVTIVRPPGAAPGILMYPGQLASLDRFAVGVQSLQPSGSGGFDTLDRVVTRDNLGTYHVKVNYSTATAAELRQAGTDYPSWLDSYRLLPGLPPPALDPNAQGEGSLHYRSPQLEEQIRALAQRVTGGQTNDYDRATAIERYLRTGFTYTLTPKAPPPSSDPLGYFLFNSKAGYCEYFASAMGDMLRALNIPTRLVNGFSDGAYDSSTRRFTIHEDDAHTWVEVYFPHYGWIPFEPTPDSTHVPIRRGDVAASTPCREAACEAQGSGKPGFGLGSLPKEQLTLPGVDGPQAPAPSTQGFALPALDPHAGAVFAALIALLLVALVVLCVRFLTPRRPGDAWRRFRTLSALAGGNRVPGETPLQLGRRLSLAFPEASAPILRLAEGYAVVAYAPASLAQSERETVMRAWHEVRPALLRRLVRRLRR